jgi:ADP-ribose pyrophosphatase
MQVLFSVFLFFGFIYNGFISIHAGEVSRNQYLELIQSSPKLMNHQGEYGKGEIQIVTDPEDMAAIEKNTGRDVGIVMRDKYWLWVNDACVFPNGTKGVYGRIL